ncbi:hypothetical protein J5S49_13480 [Virgibacillus halodenitrificans]|uniref:hypothetical protein n=1 Tax=Virgibacillus halodenitrificans TaxID=1482 RepID=UPI001F44E634|nr:hypothetical protein [Virgibacillus halodenitrificans]MCG1029303.1 hypothetical protein [Virgibacillus halodenitrificans]
MIDLSDILIIIGLLFLAIGIYFISPPIMFIVIGTVVFLIGLYGARNTPVKEKGGD